MLNDEPGGAMSSERRMAGAVIHHSAFRLQPSEKGGLSRANDVGVTVGSMSIGFIPSSTMEVCSMRMLKSQRGAELSEIIAGLLVVLVAGVAATSVMFNGLDTAAGKVATWLGGLTIPAP
jgi:hypothetical protein